MFATSLNPCLLFPLYFPLDPENIPFIEYLLCAKHGASFTSHNNPVKSHGLKIKKQRFRDQSLAKDHSIRSDSSPDCEASNSVSQIP